MEKFATSIFDHEKLFFQRGIMMAINSTQDLSSSVGRFYLPLNRTAQDDPVFSLPYIDEADGGRVPFFFAVLFASKIIIVIIMLVCTSFETLNTVLTLFVPSNSE